MESDHFLQHQLGEPRNVLGIYGRTGEVSYGFLRLRDAPADDIGHYFGECRPVAESEQVGFGQRVAHRLVLTRGTLIRPHIQVAKQFDAIQLVDPYQTFYVGLFRNIEE